MKTENKLLMDKKVVNIIGDEPKLDYHLTSGKMLVINYYSENAQDLDINITQEDNTYLVINYSSFVNSDIKVNIASQIKGSNNLCVINVRALALEGLGKVTVSASAKDGTKDNEIIEDLKGINEGGTISFMPVLEVDTCQIDAAHYATVGAFNKEELFYLQTKMLSEKMAKEILKKSFIYSLFSEEFINLINERREKYE